MKTRYSNLEFLEDYGTQNKKISLEGDMSKKKSKKSGVMNHHFQTYRLKYKLYRVDKAIFVTISAIIFLILGIMAHLFIEFESFTNLSEKEIHVKLPSLNDIEILDSEMDPYDFLSNEIESFFNSDFHQDSNDLLEKNNVLIDFIDEIQNFEPVFSKKNNKFSVLNRELNEKIIVNDAFKDKLTDFVLCEENLSFERQILINLKKELELNFSLIDEKKMKMKEISSNFFGLLFFNKIN